MRDAYPMQFAPELCADSGGLLHVYLDCRKQKRLLLALSQSAACRI